MLRSVVAVVSGGASGLGAATASAITRGGGRVVVADLPEARDNFLRLAAAACAEVHIADGAEVAEGVSCELSYHPYVTHKDKKGKTKCDFSSGPLMAFAETDVRSEQNIIDALNIAEEKFGEPVNVAINCAGICPARKTISDSKEKEGDIKVHSLQDFSDALQINALGTFNLNRLAAERMVKREADAEGLRGCIINTASIAAFEGQTGQVAYSASKGAVVGMTLPLARDLAPHGIRVMTIAPGLFKTPLLDRLPKQVQDDLGKTVPCPNRLGNPDEFGRLIVSILMNPMLNGEVIRLDGALRMPP
mmetsp:Transcript_16111/g.23564  ORF Transcript_16111/g.23564 Transcript_16111/m.23564 type:complete len:305 (-) Transcript_16111:558-1472(-)|eukprot:CAMPEP_0197236140 /NCGR_PEP_ID=MMETSP1429-20130617/3369_1 /TAXON_ID=49237 /ORGANISM="Chaetoceros  sp., Strain UNC1202" /LENGTH=304 /DNA_ID=CAMNT_0042694885 /DNA_START=36 /DNA_END=950 /DNA_ORIENTATION=-